MSLGLKTLHCQACGDSLDIGVSTTAIMVTRMLDGGGGHLTDCHLG